MCRREAEGMKESGGKEPNKYIAKLEWKGKRKEGKWKERGKK